MRGRKKKIFLWFLILRADIFFFILIILMVRLLRTVPYNYCTEYECQVRIEMSVPRASLEY
jgi:hypothetical protein